MSKLPKENQFLDLSDYGRPIASRVVLSLVNTPVSSIQITFAFLVAGIFAIYFTSSSSFYLAALFLLIKNILDAADGEMARVRNRPSQTGRYLDSIFDFFINLGVFYAVYILSGVPVWLFIAAFLCLEFQGTVFNYYYLVQRRICNGEMTSKIDEFERPVAFKYESEKLVRVLHIVYLICYGLFDKIMIYLDGNIVREQPLPNSFMTLVSSMGLGFQILLMIVFLLLDRVEWMLPFFLLYTLWALVIIVVRKSMVNSDRRASCPGPRHA